MKILIPLMSAGVNCLAWSDARCNHSLWTWWVNSFSRESTSFAIFVSTGLKFYNSDNILRLNAHKKLQQLNNESDDVTKKQP